MGEKQGFQSEKSCTAEHHDWEFWECYFNALIYIKKFSIIMA
jgi:hypothetical protein